MVEEGGRLRGVEAVVDKDLAAARLALDIAAERLVILTDVPGIAVHHGLPAQEWLGEVSVDKLRTLQAEGHFAAGSMGPKVEAALRFVEASGGEAVVAAVGDLVPALRRDAGTRVAGR
jgi:carbamate kinase